MEPYWVESLSNFDDIRLRVDTGIPVGDIGAVHCTFEVVNEFPQDETRGFGAKDMFFFGARGFINSTTKVLYLYPYMADEDRMWTVIENDLDNVYSLYSVSVVEGDTVLNYIFYTRGNGLNNKTLLNSSSHDPENLDLTTTFSLFKCAGGTNRDALPCRIYSCHIFDHDGNVISWLKPCVHPQTLKPAFYDLIRHRYLYASDSSGELAVARNFMPVHHISLTKGILPKFYIWGVETNRVAHNEYSPNPYTSRLDMGVRIRSSSEIIRYPSERPLNFIRSDVNQDVSIGLYGDGSGHMPQAFTNCNIGKTNNIIVHNNLIWNGEGIVGSDLFFINNGVVHSADASYLVDNSEFPYPIIGDNNTNPDMDIESFSMRCTAPYFGNPAIQKAVDRGEIIAFGFYYDFQPCRIIKGENSGSAAFFDYVNAQYLISDGMSAPEDICSLTVNNTATQQTPMVQSWVWQCNTP